jgi:hypothetical protein
MNIREQLAALVSHGVEFVVVGGQAGVLRQAIEFSHDLDVIIRATRDNARRVSAAVQQIAHAAPDEELILSRDFQQYIDEASGTELDVHLKLISIADFETAANNASDVDYLGVTVSVLELPALYASKRTDRQRDAVHRRAIEDRLAHLVLEGAIEIDDVVLACCLDRDVAAHPAVAPTLAERAAATSQPLLQVRLAALDLQLDRLAQNPTLHATARALIALAPAARAKLVEHPARLAALLARIPLELPPGGHHLRWLV